jgi:hypothetical protein
MRVEEQIVRGIPGAIAVASWLVYSRTFNPVIQILGAFFAYAACIIAVNLLLPSKPRRLF